jgi:hypothetical protein
MNPTLAVWSPLRESVESDSNRKTIIAVAHNLSSSPLIDDKVPLNTKCRTSFQQMQQLFHPEAAAEHQASNPKKLQPALVLSMVVCHRMIILLKLMERAQLNLCEVVCHPERWCNKQRSSTPLNMGGFPRFVVVKSGHFFNGSDCSCCQFDC